MPPTGGVATEAAPAATDPHADTASPSTTSAADASAGGAGAPDAAGSNAGDPANLQGLKADPDGEAGGDDSADVEDDDDGDDVDAELEAMKQRLKQMEEESNATSKQSTVTDAKPEGEAAPSSGSAGGATAPPAATGSSTESDARSIYVGNVDYASTPEELQAHFADCGTINRVTIMCNKVTGAPKGFAYIEFVDEDAVQNALILNESPFRGRQLKVTAKRTNVPGMSYRGGFRGGYRGRGRGRGYGYRGRPRGRWVPY